MSDRLPGATPEDLDMVEEFIRDIYGERARTIEFLEAMWKVSRLRAWEAAAHDIPKIVDSEIMNRITEGSDILTIEAVIIER